MNKATQFNAIPIDQLVFGWNQSVEWGGNLLNEAYLNIMDNGIQDVIDYDIEWDDDPEVARKQIEEFKDVSSVKDGDKWYYYQIPYGIIGLNEKDVRYDHIDYDYMMDYLDKLINQHKNIDIEGHQFYTVDDVIKALQYHAPKLYEMVKRG